MKRRIVIWNILYLATAVSSPAQSIQLTTFKNTPLHFTAADVTTNGVNGLSNTAPDLMVSAVSSVSAQQGSVSLVNSQAWTRRYDGPAHSHDLADGVVVDGMQNVIVTGYSDGSNSGADFATVKYASDGTALWTNRYDGSSHLQDYARCLALDAAGNIYVTGDSAVTSNTVDIATIKYSPNGSLLWVSRFNRYGTNYHGLAWFAVDATGNAFVTVGTFYTDERTFITLKYDPQGNAVWTNYYKGSPNGSDYAGVVAVDNSGNCIVSGGSDGEVTGFNYATLKYAPDGTAIWTNRYVGGGNDIPSWMTLDRDGNVIVTGDLMRSAHLYGTVKYSSSGIPLWTNLVPAPTYQGGNVPRVVAGAAGDVFVTGGSPGANWHDADFTTIKLSAAGVPLWTNRFFEINSNNAAPGGTAVDSAGNFYFAGHAGGPGGTNIDFVTVKYTTDGDAIWTHRYNGLTPNSSDYAEGITVDNGGNVYVTGLSGGVGSGGDFATVKYSDYIRYTPPTNFVGTDSFTFTAVDHLGNSATGVVTVVVLPCDLRFRTDPATFGPEGQGMRLHVEGACGTNQVMVFASTNLLEWQPIYTNYAVLGSIEFTDTATTNGPHRFYRARQTR